MAIRKRKISDLDVIQTLRGFFTIGFKEVSGTKTSYKADLGFIADAADNATAKATEATEAAANANEKATAASNAATSATAQVATMQKAFDALIAQKSDPTDQKPATLLIDCYDTMCVDTEMTVRVHAYPQGVNRSKVLQADLSARTKPSCVVTDSVAETFTLSAVSTLESGVYATKQITVRNFAGATTEAGVSLTTESGVQLEI